MAGAPPATTMAGDHPAGDGQKNQPWNIIEYLLGEKSFFGHIKSFLRQNKFVSFFHKINLKTLQLFF
jgi:hypothetical protein